MTTRSTTPKRIHFGMIIILTLGAITGIANAQGTRTVEHVLIETPKPYDRVVAIVTSQGGKVTHQFTYVDAISADIPTDTLNSARTLIGSASVLKDTTIPAPRSLDGAAIRNVKGSQIGPVITSQTQKVRTRSATDLRSFAGLQSDLSSLNNAGTRIGELQAKGYTGAGTIVAVIDSGYRPGFSSLDNDQSLIGGKDFVGDHKGFSDVHNDGHGTFAAGLISGNGTFVLGEPLLDAVRAYAPGALDPNTGELTLVGTAPDAKIYAVRVFGTDATAGAPLSRILDAIQHVIDIRKDYDSSGGTRGVKIDVCNLSLGVSTLNAGRSLLDRSVDALLAAGIIPVISAGNTGPSSLTIASPGSSMSALTVGGITQAANDRILAELTFGPGTGVLYQPSSGTQTAWFSSRGPNADGRLDPDVVVSALANFAQGYCPKQVLDACDGTLSIASGTSFSAPIVSGIAATLRQAFPNATATEIRNSIVSSARTSLINDRSQDIDRGNGVPDAVAAYNLIASGKARDYLPPTGRVDEEVSRNVERNTDLNVYSGNVQLSTGTLVPGQRYDVLYNVAPGTKTVVVSINDLVFSLPPSQQNPLFGSDDIFASIHSAKTSSIGANGDYAVGFYTVQSPFVVEDTQFVVTDPDTGIMRITLLGDFINAGAVSATVRVYSVQEPQSEFTRSGTIGDKGTLTIPLVFPNGVQEADFLLRWNDDWGHFPTSDIDMTIIDPKGKVYVNASGTQPGATLASPERVGIANPLKGTWQVIVNGFNIPAGTDTFQLRVLLDGRVLKP